MPVVSVPDPQGKGRQCFRWGNSGKIYCGRGARRKAEAQGAAARSSGYKETKK